MATLEKGFLPVNVKGIIGYTTTEAAQMAKQNPNVILLHIEVDSAGTIKLNVFVEESIIGTFTAHEILNIT